MPKLSPAQKQQLWQSKINRGLKGYSPARDIWSQAKGRCGIDPKVLKYAFNLNLAGEADNLHLVCSSVRDWERVEKEVIQQWQREHVRRHLQRVLGIVAEYDKRCKQRHQLEPNPGWQTLINALSAVRAKANSGAQGIH